MITISSAILCLALAQQPAPTVLDQRSLPALGQVTLRGEGHRMRLELVLADSRRSQDFELDDLPVTARILSGKVCSFVRDGIVIAFSIGEGESTSYHLLLSPKAPTRADPIRISDLSAPERGWPSTDSMPAWSLTRAIFVSTGEPYRILDMHDPGGDSLEITFRRGWPKLGAPDMRMDEKILFDPCGLALLAPLPSNWREPGDSFPVFLLDVTEVRRAGSPR